MISLSYLALVALASAASCPKIPKASTLKMEFLISKANSRASSMEGAAVELVKKDDMQELALINHFTFYSTTLRVGPQGAEIDVLIDTGSSDLWVMSSEIQCLTTPDSQSSCAQVDSFATADSDSFKVNSTAPEFHISYLSNTYAKGYWGHDYVAFGEIRIPDCSFAVVNETTSRHSVFGIGLAQSESTYSGINRRSTPYTYENFPLRLKSTGLINKVLYSLYLNASDALTGSILFGAVDHARYTGQLHTVPLVNINAQYFAKPIRFDIILDSITLESTSHNVSVFLSQVLALLDSGASLTYLPGAILDGFASLLGAYMNSSEAYTINCEKASDRIFTVFYFSGARIKVPLSDLIFRLGSSCYLGILELPSDQLSGASYAILGDNFLRSAYVVYDLEEYEISLAQAFHGSEENIEVVTSSIPLATRNGGPLSRSLANMSSSSQLTPTGQKQFTGTISFATSVLLAVFGVCVLLAF
ncbi:acid protease [Metschnikowia bicuspidata var. bicuspidata NRRL YB-4993]|uniref:candidapepsin n=1 Tax=Metschnikowia bicuspidata var. bicuspidata NRRL YB-4993 TaxID=869754 RepID=A0A1A0HFE3_9ASCO|nr:acid protease [Metschnikowia bicuspidata var. bicuspidata NRRL YB-4993]OBA22588.1 acid protease [Metschnikowia bicuspidata var. bicuspidata NRRL YB-4993]